jgi:gliding motility-associated-like protein
VEVIPIVDAFDDSVATMENMPVDLDILGNDNDIPILGTITTTSPSNGILAVNNNGTPNDLRDDTVTYTPNNGYVGSDLFTYTICDDQSNCSTATVNILVNPFGIVDIDSDDDGILDSFEDLNLDADNDPSTDPTDSDGDGIPDYLDIDSDNDGIPDNIEAQTTQGYLPPSGVDANNNGLDDAYENNGNLGLFPIDTDGDSLPDYLDEDSDNDNVPDSIEGHDHDHDGIPDVVYIGSDKDNDGLDDGYEGSTTIDVDVNDEINDPYNDLPNTDGDDEVDFRDNDDDDDGILTADEDENGDGNYANDDFDGDGIPNYLDSDLIVLDDEVEVFNVITPNNDGIHDVLTIRGIENYPNNTIKIYNRWGVLVYATKAYNNDSNYFDGTSEGRVTVAKDNQLPVGTYFYILDYSPSEGGKMTTLTGYIYINR